jgi:hypothetical protein
MAVFGSGHGFSTLIPAALITDRFKIFAATPRDPTHEKNSQLDHLVVRETRKNLIQNFNFDLAVIAVPPFEQLDLARALVKKSSNLYIEKPAGLNSLEATALDNLAKENNCEIYVGFQFRFDPGIQYLKNFLQIPTSSRLSKVVIDWHTTGSSGKNDPLNWRNDSSKGGGVKKDFLVHVVDYLINLFGIENLENRSDWEVLQDELNRISIKFSGFIDIEVKISRGFFKESYWKVKCYGGTDDLVIQHSAPFSSSDYTCSDNLFLKSLDKYQKTTDIRIHSTSQLFDAIAKRISCKIDRPTGLPTIDDSLIVHRLIESIFSFPS